MGRPVILDLTTRVLKPYEDHRSRRFVDQAVARLDHVQPRVVAITGSTVRPRPRTTSPNSWGDDGVVSTPRSFNNRAGLSRAINENLADGTRVFVAEMGTYGPRRDTVALFVVCSEIAIVTGSDRFSPRNA